MTNEEAIRIINNQQNNLVPQLDNPLANDIYDANDIALIALYKQIPKKVMRVESEKDLLTCLYRCPICGMGMGFYDGECEISHCGNCGQALDWRSDKNDQ